MWERISEVVRTGDFSINILCVLGWDFWILHVRKVLIRHQVWVPLVSSCVTRPYLEQSPHMYLKPIIFPLQFISNFTSRIWLVLEPNREPQITLSLWSFHSSTYLHQVLWNLSHMMQLGLLVCPDYFIIVICLLCDLRKSFYFSMCSASCLGQKDDVHVSPICN